MTPELEDEQVFLLRSLADLDREHEAGDISDADLGELRARYQGRLQEVELALAGLEPVDGPRLGRRWGRRLLGVVVVVALAAGAGLGVASTAGRREAGDTITGAVPTTTAGKLARASALAADNEFVDALEAYDEVLETAPDNVEALAERGLLLLSLSQATGRPTLATAARASIDRALLVDPDDPRTLFYLGLCLRLGGDDEAADVAFERALAADPPADLRGRIEAFRASLPPPTTTTTTAPVETTTSSTP